MNDKYTYLDIVSDSISHFTDIPPEFIKSRFEKLVDSSSRNGRLLKSLMKVEFPESEAMVLAGYLKSLTLENAIMYIGNSLKMYNDEMLSRSIFN